MTSHDTIISHVTLKSIMFWPTSPGFALLCAAKLTSNSFRLFSARFSLLSGAWCPAHFVDSRPSMQVSGHSWRKIEIRWWFVKLTMLGLIKDEKTNDSPFWLVSTRPSRLTFYWYRTFNRSDAPKLWYSCSSKMMMHPLVSWWATSTQAGKHTSQADGLTMRETESMLTHYEKYTVRLPTERPILSQINISSPNLYAGLMRRQQPYT